MFTFSGIDVTVADISRFTFVFVDQSFYFISVTHRSLNRHFITFVKNSLSTRRNLTDDYGFSRFRFEKTTVSYDF